MDQDQLKALVKQPGVSDEAAGVVLTAFEYSLERIIDGDEIMPHVAFIKHGQSAVMATQFLEKLDGLDKDAWADIMQNLRKDCEVVVFCSEIWMNKIEKESWSYGNHTRPKDDPERTEGVIVNLYLGQRTVAFVADIHRNPDGLGDWRMMHDSAGATTEDRLGGRFS